VTPLTESEEKTLFNSLTHIGAVFLLTTVFGDALECLAEEDLLVCDLHWWASQMLKKDMGDQASYYLTTILATTHRSVSLLSGDLYSNTAPGG
jgi:hypothetical protein